MKINYEETKEVLHLINNWMKLSPENTHAALASLLNYKSSNTIYGWLYHKKIPNKELKNIKRVIGEPEHDTNQTCIKKVSTT